MEHIDSELILLTDADVEFAPTCVSSAVAELQLRQLDLLSIYPQFEFMTFCETMLVPIYVVGGALLLARPSNKFNAVIALAFPCMSIQFAASCLQPHVCRRSICFLPKAGYNGAVVTSTSASHTRNLMQNRRQRTVGAVPHENSSSSAS